MNFLKNACGLSQLSGFYRNISLFNYNTKHYVHTVVSPLPFSQCKNPLQKRTNLVIDNLINFIPFRGLKVQLRARKRCTHCYLVWKDNRVFNYCKVKPRHNHATIIPKDKFRLIITHKTHGRIRPW